jgi:hypothetical protein
VCETPRQLAFTTGKDLDKLAVLRSILESVAVDFLGLLLFGALLGRINGALCAPPMIFDSFE